MGNEFPMAFLVMCVIKLSNLYYLEIKRDWLNVRQVFQVDLTPRLIASVNAKTMISKVHVSQSAEFIITPYYGGIHKLR